MTSVFGLACECHSPTYLRLCLHSIITCVSHYTFRPLTGSMLESWTRLLDLIANLCSVIFGVNERLNVQFFK